MTSSCYIKNEVLPWSARSFRVFKPLWAALMRPQRSKQDCLQIEFIYIYIYINGRQVVVPDKNSAQCLKAETIGTIGTTKFSTKTQLKLATAVWITWNASLSSITTKFSALPPQDRNLDATAEWKTSARWVIIASHPVLSTEHTSRLTPTQQESLTSDSRKDHSSNDTTTTRYPSETENAKTALNSPSTSGNSRTNILATNTLDHTRKSRRLQQQDKALQLMPDGKTSHH